METNISRGKGNTIMKKRRRRKTRRNKKKQEAAAKAVPWGNRRKSTTKKVAVDGGKDEYFRESLPFYSSASAATSSVLALFKVNENEIPAFITEGDVFFRAF